MRSTRSLLAQVAHTIGSMLAGQGSIMAAGIAVARIYGPAGKGMLTYAGIAIMVAMAIADGLAAAIADRCGDDPQAARASHAAAQRIIAIAALCTVAPLLACGLLFTSQHPLLYVAAAFPFVLYSQTMTSFYLLTQRVERTNVAALVANAAPACVILFVVLTVRPPIDVILAIFTCGYIAGAIVIFAGLGSLRAGAVDARTLQAELVRHIRFAARSSLASTMTYLAVRVDVFIVSATLSPSALGSYTLVLAAGDLMWQVSRAISWPLFGRVASEKFAEAASLTAKVTRIVIAIETVAAIVAFVAGPAVVALVYGPAFSDAGLVLRLLVPGMAIYGADAILTYFLSVKAGRVATIVRVEAITLLVCAVGTLATVRSLGIVGPAIATLLAYLTSFAVKAVMFVRATGLTPRELLVVRRADFALGFTLRFERSQAEPF